MSKFKKFFEDLIFESPESDEVGETTIKEETVQAKPAVAPVEKKVEKPVEVKRSSTPVIDLTAGEKMPEVVHPQQETTLVQERTFINVDSEINVPAEVEKEIEIPTAEAPQKEETPKMEPKKVEYQRSSIISPIFGVQQNTEEKPVRRKKTIIEEPKLSSNQDNKESVIGTVLSPLYGDKEADIIKNDVIDKKIANMTVAEVIATPKKVAKVEIESPKSTVKIKEVGELKPIENTVKEAAPATEEVLTDFETIKKEYSQLKSSVASWNTQEEKENEIIETRPDLSVTPFGVSKDEVDDASPTKKLNFSGSLDQKKEIVGEDGLEKEESEQLSLFD